MSREKKSSPDITVDIEVQCSLVDFDRQKMTDIVAKTLKRFGMDQADVSIAVLDHEAIISINKRFLDRDKTTDVISFNLCDEGKKAFDIAVNAEMAAEQGRIRGHSGAAELTLYVIHGLLHHLGFDDLDETDATKMHNAEDELLGEFGYGRVYYADDKNDL